MPAPDDRAGAPANSTRATPRMLLIVTAALLLARVVSGLYEARHAPEPIDLMNWRPIAIAEAEARATRKPILYEFSAEWCGPCKVMKRDLFADRQTANEIGRMLIPVSVVDRSREDGANSPEVAALEARFHIEAFPTLVVVRGDDSGGEKLEGYPGAWKTLLWLRTAAVGPRDRFVGRKVPAFPLPDSALRP